MRTLNRNKQTIYYALYDHREEIRDSFNNYTGEFRVVYSTPTSMEANISPAFGRTTFNVFGVEFKYSRTMVVDNIGCPINETSQIWFGVPTTQAPNYRVVLKSVSLNSVTYYLQEIYEANVVEPQVETQAENETQEVEPSEVEEDLTEPQPTELPNLLNEDYM